MGASLFNTTEECGPVVLALLGNAQDALSVPSVTQSSLMSFMSLGCYGSLWSFCTSASLRTLWVECYYDHTQIGLPRQSSHPFLVLCFKAIM